MALEPVDAPGPSVEIAAGTDRGLVRTSNEDSYAILQGRAVPHWCIAVAAVFDGVGGLSNGLEASSRAARHIAELLKAPTLKRVPRRGPGEVVAHLMLGLHSRLREDRLDEPALQTMATTATVALLARSSPAILWIGHVASPLFLCRRLTDQD